MTDQPVTCPDCSGQRHRTVHVRGIRDGRTFGEWRQEPCPLCAGTGTVAASLASQVKERRAEGERRREDRKVRGLSLREEARRIGVTPQELSRIENGRVVDGEGRGD